MEIHKGSSLVDRCRHVISKYKLTNFNSVEVAEKLAKDDLLFMETVLDVRDALVEFYGKPG